MRWNYFLISLIIFNQECSADFISLGLGTTIATSALVIVTQAGRAGFYAYSGTKEPLCYTPGYYSLASEVNSEEELEILKSKPEYVYSQKEFITGMAVLSCALLADLLGTKKPLNVMDTLIEAPIAATSFLSGPLGDELSGKQEAICFLSTCVMHWALWKVIKRSAEWYVRRQGTVPMMSYDDLKHEAQFTPVMEKEFRTCYAQLDTKNYKNCPICFGSIIPDTLHITRCKQPKAYAVHYYHTECIDDWKKKGHTGCPTCRGTMLGFRMPMPSASVSWLLSTPVGIIKSIFT